MVLMRLNKVDIGHQTTDLNAGDGNEVLGTETTLNDLSRNWHKGIKSMLTLLVSQWVLQRIIVEKVIKKVGLKFCFLKQICIVTINKSAFELNQCVELK